MSGQVLRQFSLTGYVTPESLAEKIREGSPKNHRLVASKVSKILSAVQSEGDAALIRFANEHDRSNFKSSRELITKDREFEEAYSSLEPSDVSALRASYNQVKWLAKKQIKRFEEIEYLTPLGFKITERYAPLRSVGGYIPGGRASYPSTVAMICAPAVEAGVNEIVLATPALMGHVNPAVLVAANICGVSKVFKVGGAQAISALAFGTETVRKVDLIAGPGNEYVTEAKKQVLSRGAVAIDSLAGPTELLILADSTSDPNLILLDLISQAEHGNRTLCGLVTDSEKIIDSVTWNLRNAKPFARYSSILESLMFTIKTQSMEEALKFAEVFSPEHLEIMTEKPLRFQVSRSGLVLRGKFAPCSASDYIVGTSHILPTGGSAARSSGVSVETFLKRVTEISGTKNTVERSVNSISRISNLEGLPNHALASLARIRVSKN